MTGSTIREAFDVVVTFMVAAGSVLTSAVLAWLQ